MELVLITGLSGAGKGVVLRTLEDIGFEAIDNVPPAFLSALVHSAGEAKRLTIATDIRSRDFSADDFLQAIAPFKNNSAVKFTLIYMECDDEILQQRFTETRRRHPLALDRPVMDGIHHERKLIEKLRSHADWVIDSSKLEAAECRRIVQGHFGGAHRQLSVVVTSFAFRHGLPREADLVFDVRFLQNPHYVDVLQPLTGLQEKVGQYIAADPSYADFFENLTRLISPLLPRYQNEGKHYLTIAIGCTGGKHRSVFVTEQLSAWLKKNGVAQLTTQHRDLVNV